MSMRKITVTEGDYNRKSNAVGLFLLATLTSLIGAEASQDPVMAFLFIVISIQFLWATFAGIRRGVAFRLWKYMPGEDMEWTLDDVDTDDFQDSRTTTVVIHE